MIVQELENRGLHEEGLYRVGGVTSKVKNLLNKVSGPSMSTFIYGNYIYSTEKVIVNNMSLDL